MFRFMVELPREGFLMNPPLAPSNIRSPMRARIGATPVPGPMQMTGVEVSSGSSMYPLRMPMSRMSPVII